jgi:cbb3-type cytochrome oxidase subunit 1
MAADNSCCGYYTSAGINISKEYAELEWPIDIAITLVWVAFGINMFGTIIKRRESHMYVAIWFYIATWVTVAVLHIVNSLAVPAGLFKSYSIYAGVQDALVQWWYGHNAVAFFLTTPYLGLCIISSQGSKQTNILIQVINTSLLVIDIHLYMGRSSSSSLYCTA